MVQALGGKKGIWRKVGAGREGVRAPYAWSVVVSEGVKDVHYRGSHEKQA